MPELAEVETVRRLLERRLLSRAIVEAEVAPDEIVLQGRDPAEVRASLMGARVSGVGRKGKTWWVELDRRPWLFGHLGMGGWIRDVTGMKPGEVRDENRLKEHGSAPLDDHEGRPRFLKLMLTTEDGGRVAMTDGRRLARLWLANSPEEDPKVAALGPDVWLEPWLVEQLATRLSGRSAPIKSLMLDQRLFAGVGNWLADEALYQAGVRPDRAAGSLAVEELQRILASLNEVLRVAIEAEADERRYPPHWLFNYRWGGRRGHDEIEGHPIVRIQVGGRPPAWVPGRQQ